MRGDGGTATASAPGTPLVAGEHLTVRYHKRTVLDVPSIAIPQGRTYALLGASGAGKSTLLGLLGLLEKPTTGTVSFEGRRASRGDLRIRRQIAAVFQKPHLLRGTIGQNVEYGLKLRHMSRADRRYRVADALMRVGMAGWEDRSAPTLSGGEAQRVALARALVLQPRLLLLDEPLSYLDPLLKRSLTREFAAILKSERVTAFYVTHDQDEAAVVADIIGIMREGRIVAEGDPKAVLSLPSDAWLASFLGMEPPFGGVVEASDDGLARIRCGGFDISARTSQPVGAEVLVGVRPEDILLLERGADMPTLSGHNRVDGVVAHADLLGAMARVVVIASDRRIAANVSASSASELELQPGSPVTLLFRTSAARVRRRDRPGP